MISRAGKWHTRHFYRIPNTGFRFRDPHFAYRVSGKHNPNKTRSRDARLTCYLSHYMENCQVNGHTLLLLDIRLHINVPIAFMLMYKYTDLANVYDRPK